jgi:hypothetical protein
MSESVRQSSLFAAEDYKKVFKAYQFIDYTAYDFDTLKQALMNYIQTYYPEDFNDYIESSEFVAIIELLAYFGTSLAFRTELNSRENFIDTAERRESIIRLAQMVNYVPRRNIPASGLFKISSVQTDQPLTDANGVNLNDVSIFWNDPNNPDWFDQFIQIANAAFSTLNPFGRPTKSGTIGSIPTDLYQLNNILRLTVAYQSSITINAQQFPIDICNPDFVTNETIFERDPDPATPFNFIYRNDSLGVASANTGFFLYFKQGTLMNVDTNFDFPVPNRVFPIAISNINQDDVYAQETDQNGNVISKWKKVPALAGENIIYNSIQFSERNIFDVISGASDTVSIRFADGNFGNVPTGLFRFWVRTSANQALVIRPDDAQGLQINIPYIGADQQQYTLRVVFNLEQTIGNAAATETDEQIKLRAPEVFSTQSRMVNGSDYNVLPLIYGNQISKIQAVNRTFSGQSRYIDLNDPTGFHKDLIIFGQDGALYREDQNLLAEVVRDASNLGNIQTVIVNTIQEMLRSDRVSKFFYDEYIPQFEEKVRVNQTAFPVGPGASLAGKSLLDLSNSAQLQLYWKTSPQKFKNDTGYFANAPASTAAVALVNTFTDNVLVGTNQAWGFIRTGATVEFADPTNIDKTRNTAGVSSVIQNGLQLVVNPANQFSAIGPVELSIEEQNSTALNPYRAIKVYPIFRNELSSTEVQEVISRVAAGSSFWMYYDLLDDVWKTTLGTMPAPPFVYPPTTGTGIYSDWALYPASGLVYVNINSVSSTVTYDVTVRGRSYVFESYRDVRFYWEPNQSVIDNATGLALQDTIEIMPGINTNKTVDNNEPIPLSLVNMLPKQVSFNITGVFTQDDGYVDNSKVEVSLVDSNDDGVTDSPEGFNEIVSSTDRVVFEYYANEVTGYQSTRPWVSKWNILLENDDPLVVNPPTLPAVGVINGTISGTSGAVDMAGVDLLFVKDAGILTSIAAQLTAAFIVDGSVDKVETYNQFFLNKTYVVKNEPGYGVYYSLSLTYPLSNPSGLISVVVDATHYDRNGKVFTQNTTYNTDQQLPLYFKWSHYSPIDQRVDPSPMNIIDMIVITDGYYRDVTIWKNTNGTLATFPAAPTTEELRIQFQDLNQYKMLSDSMIWNSGKFKLLFGSQAQPELQATFKVVKAPSNNISDNEVKTKVIQAIDTYFDIRNWDFGEKFFYTELAAFIHQQLSRVISSVVIVPNNASSVFGDLFEIIASTDEIFMSTATVSNVQIVSNLTNQNLRT